MFDGKAESASGSCVDILPGTLKLSDDIREPSQSLVWHALSHFNTATF